MLPASKGISPLFYFFDMRASSFDEFIFASKRVGKLVFDLLGRLELGLRQIELGRRFVREEFVVHRKRDPVQETGLGGLRLKGGSMLRRRARGASADVDIRRRASTG